MRRFSLVLTMALALVTIACRSETSETTTVLSIVDGDTISVSAGATVETVRLLGIDTPESVDPSRPVQCFGTEATARLYELIPPGTIVRLTRDQDARDAFGRLLAYIHRPADGLFINEAMVLDGFAAVSIYEPNSAHRLALEQAELTARTQERGLWGVCGGPDVPIDPPPVVNAATE